jgi:hypothetical protein
MAGKKSKRKPAQNLDRLQVWTPAQAAQWSGMKYRLLLRFLRDGRVPYIEAAPANRETATSRRIYLIPREPFQKWLTGITAPGPDRDAA